MVPAGETGVPFLKDRYVLLRELGSGGEIRLVQALDQQDGHLVALSIRSMGSGLGGEDWAPRVGVRLGQELHPSLPVVRDDFVEGDQHVIAVDWVEGTDLARLLLTRGTPGLAPSSVLAYLAEAAEALTFLHSQEPPIVHGDVKPANLILTRGGRVKLVGYGLASTQDGERKRAGSSGFRAPELMAGSPATRASDVYALAATAFALLGGAPSIKQTPGSVDDLPTARLRDAIGAGLLTDPLRRPSTPGELIDGLRRSWAATLPTGVMTFCTSDIVGSTTLWEQQPHAMAEALVRHDEVIASVVEAHGGRFLKSMGAGDSTVSVFALASQAVRAAGQVMQVLSAESWPTGAPIQVRIGLHTGDAQRRGVDYLGPTLNLVARVRDQGSAGEVLLSSATAALVSGDLPAGCSLIDLGTHRLKGIEHPESIKALAGPYLATAPTAGECPYRGLLAFAPEDRHLFFGREEVVADVLQRISRERLLAVVGPSGSGKSSVLGAGVLAAVRDGELTSVSTARLITPGSQPPLDLGADASELLVVDQFEELYTQCRDLDLRARFLNALLCRPGPVVIGVRADFYGEMSADPALAVAVANNQVLLGPMRDDELRRAIEEPARLAGLRLEPGFLDVVLNEVAGEPGALPLMSHALRETWGRRDGRTLTVAAYRDSGGVGSAVAQTADAVANATPEAERALLRSMLLRLTELGHDVEDTRRRVRVEELVPHGSPMDTVKALLERLATARLVILDEGSAELAHEVLIRRWPTLRRWLDEDREGIRLHRRLSEAARLWNSSGREPADLYRGARLDAASEWARSNGVLLNSLEEDFLKASVTELASTQQRQTKTNRRLRRALVGSAILLITVVATLASALASRSAAVRAEAHARSRALATEAESQLARDPQRALLLARKALQAAGTPEAELATSEALDANTVRSQLPPLGIQGCADSNYLILFDGGRQAADDTCDGYVVFADLIAGRITKKIRVGPTTADMVLDSTGQALIVATGQHLVTVDMHTGDVRQIFTAPWRIAQLASLTGQYVAIANADTIGVVDLKRGRLRVIARGDPSVNIVNGMMTASARSLLVVTTGQSPGRGDLFAGVTALDVFDGTRHTVALEPAPDLAAVVYLRVSPDQRTWFITGADVNAQHNNQVATTWAIDAGTRHVLWSAEGPAGAYASPVQVSPDGRRVAVGYSTGAADVLDAHTGQLVVRDSSSSAVASGDLALTNGNDTLVTASLDGLLRTWTARGSELLRLQTPPDPALDFTSDGRSLVLVGDRGEIVDATTGRTVRTFPGFPAGSVVNYCNSCFAATPGLTRISFLDPTAASPRISEIDGNTGKLLASVSVPRLDSQGVAPDGRIVSAYTDGDKMFVRISDPRSGQHQDLPTGESSSGCTSTPPGFTADGRLMAIADSCIHINVWDLHQGTVKPAIVLPDRSTGSGVRLSPDGRFVLVMVPGGGFARGDLSSRRVVEVPGAQAEGNVLSVSPDGRFYAVGRQDGTVDEFSASSLRLVRRHSLIDAIETIAFSPDSRDIAVGDIRNVVRIWDTCDICQDRARLLEQAAAHTVRELTADEKASFNVG